MEKNKIVNKIKYVKDIFLLAKKAREAIFLKKGEAGD